MSSWRLYRQSPCGLKRILQRGSFSKASTVTHCSCVTCDTDDVISGGGNEPPLFSRNYIPLRRTGHNWFLVCYLVNCFKVIAHSCSCLGPKVISYCVIRAQELYEFLLGGSRDGERRWGKEAEKIASQIAAAQTAFAAEIHLCLSLSPINYMMWL